jgi:hypothetical protein
MTPNQEFWWNWWVQAAVALGTLLAVVVALFGDAIRGLCVRLSCSIENPHGVHTPILISRRYVIQGQPEHDKGESRYYQLRVRNECALVRAHRVDVWLLRVDVYGANGPIHTWTGEIPLAWQHKDFFPGPRTIGEAVNADVFTITKINKSETLTLQAAISALNLPGPFTDRCHLLLTVQIRSDERNSDNIQIRVEWDGMWERGDELMSKHVTFEIVPPTG